MPKTWSPIRVTSSPTKFMIKMRDSDHPTSQEQVLPAVYDTEQAARQAIDDWKKAPVQKAQ